MSVCEWLKVGGYGARADHDLFLTHVTWWQGDYGQECRKAEKTTEVTAWNGKTRGPPPGHCIPMTMAGTAKKPYALLLNGLELEPWKPVGDKTMAMSWRGLRVQVCMCPFGSINADQGVPSKTSPKPEKWENELPLFKSPSPFFHVWWDSVLWPPPKSVLVFSTVSKCFGEALNTLKFHS